MMGNDEMDYGLKLVLNLRDHFDELHPRDGAGRHSNAYGFSGGVDEGFPTRKEGSFEVPGLEEQVEYTLNGGPLLRMTHSYDEIDRALSSGSPFI